jgi:hypothetical protein
MIPKTQSSARTALLAAALLLSSCGKAAAPDKQKPELFLLSALPLIWGEQFGLDQPGQPAIEALEKRYRITAIDLPSQLPERGLLLAAQPRALPAEELVELDAWTRRGGRMLLLADPLLEWRSELPLGDRRRPPFAFADTGLLGHWGLRLDAPESRGPRTGAIGRTTVLTASPGTIVRTSGDCAVENGGLVARCMVGSGRATIIADADLLNLGAGGIDGPTDGNLPALISQLDSLNR